MKHAVSHAMHAMSLQCVHDYLLHDYPRRIVPDLLLTRMQVAPVAEDGSTDNPLFHGKRR